jgi:hypothetical protein
VQYLSDPNDEGFTMDIKPIYDYQLVDSIRVLEQRYQAQLEQARESVRLLSRSVNVLRNRRLELEMVEMSDA